MEPVTAECIFDFLTAKNPTVEYPKTTSKTNSSSPWWYTPKELKEWDEFNFETLEAIYGGEIMSAARRKGNSLPPYPYLRPEIDCVVSDEPTTTHLITKWNHTIVTASLGLVKEFRPCEWVPRAVTTTQEQTHQTNSNKKRNQQPRSRNQSIGYPKRKPAVKLRPDAGGSLTLSTDAPNEPATVESLPKDYKTGSKWLSSEVLKKHLIKHTGNWRPHSTKKNEIMPIRQIYTYCVRHSCRYGCILTTKEAFIFRIKPRIARQGPTTVTSSSDRRELKRRLAVDGMMEYVSVPWDNHRCQNSEEYRDLTINLALWFIHILAGNGHESSWDYNALVTETPLPEPDSSVSVLTGSEPALRREGSSQLGQEVQLNTLSSFSKKRGRSPLDEDVIHYSFSMDQNLSTQSTDCVTRDLIQSQTSDILSEKGETESDNSQTSDSQRHLTTQGTDRHGKRRRLGGSFK